MLVRTPLFLLAGLLLLAPAASACAGLSPGDNIIADGSSCTLAFLVADPSGLYFMTAGHCIAEGSRVTSPGVGEWGTGAFTHLTGESANGAGSPGNDFALIHIDLDKYGDVNPKMCGWEGPTGIFQDKVTSGGVRHYGYGILLGDTEFTRAREGFNLQYDGGDVYRWTGTGVSGDSGSGVIAADGRALGVLTHLSISPATVGTNAGTHIDRGFALAREAGFQLQLVLAGEDPIAVLAELRGRPMPTTPAPEGGEATNETGGNTSAGGNEEPQQGSNETPAGGSSSPGTTPAGTTDPIQPARDDGKPAKAIPTLSAPLVVLGALAVALIARRR